MILRSAPKTLDVKTLYIKFKKVISPNSTLKEFSTTYSDAY